MTANHVYVFCVPPSERGTHPGLHGFPSGLVPAAGLHQHQPRHAGPQRQHRAGADNEHHHLPHPNGGRRRRGPHGDLRPQHLLVSNEGALSLCTNNLLNL